MSEAGQSWLATFSGTIPARPWFGAHLSIFHLFFYSNLLLIWRVTPRHQIHDRSDGGDVRSRYPDVDCNARAVYGNLVGCYPKERVIHSSPNEQALRCRELSTGTIR